MLALSMVTQREGLKCTSFGVAIALILGSNGFTQLTIQYIRLLNPEAAKRLEVWYRLPKDAPVPTSILRSNTEDQNDLFSLLCNLDLDVSLLPHCSAPAYPPPQPRHIDVKRTSAEHDAWTSTITQRVLFGGQSDICQTKEFNALKEGFNYHLRRIEDDKWLTGVSTLLAIAHTQH